MSKTGAGKSSAGNTILGQEHFEKRASPQSVTRTCARGEAQIDNRVISVIDTPGLFDTLMSEEQLRDELMRCIEMSVPGPHVFLLVISLGVRFTEEEKNTVTWIRENFGEDAVRYTIILFTHTDHLRGQSLDEYISESNVLQALVNECGRRFHSFNNEDMENRSQVTDLLNAIDAMVRINGGQRYTNEMYQLAQNNIKWEAFKQKLKKTVIEGGKTAVAVLAGAVGGGGGGGGGAAATTGAAAAATRGAAAAATTGVAAVAAAAGGAANTATEAASVLTGRGVIFAAAGGAALLVLKGIGKGVLTAARVAGGPAVTAVRGAAALASKFRP